MTRMLALSIALSLTSALAAQDSQPSPPPDRGAPEAVPTSVLDRFLAHQTEPLVRYRATRRLEAENKRFNVKGWMEVTTELSPEQGFTWTVVDEGGSGYIRNKVLRKTLEGEAQAVRNNDPAKAALTEANYTFALTPPRDAKSKRPADDDEDSAGGSKDPPLQGSEDPPLQGGERASSDERPMGELARLFITPKRKDMMLVDGAVLVAAADADLLQVEGRLSKTPSFWTRSVDIVRRYARVGGIRVPVLTESTANVRIAGRSAFKMTYTYHMINGRDVATETSPR
jgi:hypothetical protein